MDKKTIIIATIKSQVALYDQLLFSPRAFCVLLPRLFSVPTKCKACLHDHLLLHGQLFDYHHHDQSYPYQPLQHQWTPTDRFQADLDMMETWKIQADYEELMMEKYKQSLHIMTISFLPSYQYFETFYFLQESKWLSSNMLDYFKTWYYCLQHNICYWNQRHVWVRKFLNYSTFYWNTPKTSIYQVSKKQQHSWGTFKAAFPIYILLIKSSDSMPYHHIWYSFYVPIFISRPWRPATPGASCRRGVSGGVEGITGKIIIQSSLQCYHPIWEGSSFYTMQTYIVSTEPPLHVVDIFDWYIRCL